jgi:hypothetical protein
MSKVLERRREFLGILRQCTLERGYFTVTDLAHAADVPRSTAQDWIHRFIEEDCVVEQSVTRGRHPARYAATSALPRSACRRIFTTVDGEDVEIFHECMSMGCAAFCEHHHRTAGGVLTHVRRDGTLLRERARLGVQDADIGLHPCAAVGVPAVSIDGPWVTQQIRCVGGPAYSLTDMMTMADGVEEIQVHRTGTIVEGSVKTRALLHVVIGIDDTDSPEGGATFALALALLQHLSKLPGVFPIGHHVVMLNPALEGKTMGNSASLLELAIEPAVCPRVTEAVWRFVEDEALSPDWGVAIKRGFRVPDVLLAFGNEARQSTTTRTQATAIASSAGIVLRGGRGIIGALAATAFTGQPSTVLLDPHAPALRTHSGGRSDF